MFMFLKLMVFLMYSVTTLLLIHIHSDVTRYKMAPAESTPLSLPMAASVPELAELPSLVTISFEVSIEAKDVTALETSQDGFMTRVPGGMLDGADPEISKSRPPVVSYDI